MSLSSSVDEGAPAAGPAAVWREDRARFRQGRLCVRRRQAEHCAHNYARPGGERAGVQRDAVFVFPAAVCGGLGRERGPVRDSEAGGVRAGAPAGGHGGRDQRSEAGTDAQTAQPRAAGPVARAQRWPAPAGAWAQTAREQRAHPETTAASQRTTKGAEHK
ncbi:hypothetical protein KL930_004444 [Ogataea haglerorum]|uniref:Uncharacterized protein n=1 Tax=Ogataea haglerorum TaxID=1937702 RepID=A0AAN6HYS7_9ASCO|nr:uncharacterized protein KL911_004798 [Ogataea haglerorum]KAG7692572.1 hypothetical protein KL915_004619 [Ogataea haglerorum]KAG7692808.1 hypothetical protein KL951_004819 [Ogataea haglerorum]KAG7703519.1 hypothetical protein KL950_004747 [Ogataea haglerorum]KAG7703917.1 hypothetical protein KL914_004408 [Ogataea haglerorum]KAG7725300.1 hypothetical protein KL933_004314 [Ogataea haglerorum]